MESSEILEEVTRLEHKIKRIKIEADEVVCQCDKCFDSIRLLKEKIKQK